MQRRQIPFSGSRISSMHFNANAARRDRVPRQQHQVTNWAEEDACGPCVCAIHCGHCILQCPGVMGEIVLVNQLFGPAA